MFWKNKSNSEVFSSLPFTKFLLFGVLALAPHLSQASTVVCKGKVDFYGQLQDFQVKIDQDGMGQAYTKSIIHQIEVSGASLPKPHVFSSASDYWDGHSSGLVTAAGFSMLYDQAFGCIRNAVVTTDFRGDVDQEGMTVGHLTQSQVVLLCDNGNQLCQ